MSRRVGPEDPPDEELPLFSPRPPQPKMPSPWMLFAAQAARIERDFDSEEGKTYSEAAPEPTIFGGVPVVPLPKNSTLPGLVAINLEHIEARAARDAAIEQVGENAGEWIFHAVAAIGRLAQRMPEMTTDDLWREINPPAEPRAAGAAMQDAARAGLIQATSQWRESKRVACHARPMRVWRSLIYRGEK